MLHVFFFLLEESYCFLEFTDREERKLNFRVVLREDPVF